jgi:DNA-binding IclR family transcriptional regulator
MADKGAGNSEVYIDLEQPAGITDELMSALVRAVGQLDSGEGYMTCVDLVEATGLSEYAVHRRLKRLVADGKVVVGKVPRYNIGGQRYFAWAYKFQE